MRRKAQSDCNAIKLFALSFRLSAQNGPVHHEIEKEAPEHVKTCVYPVAGIGFRNKGQEYLEYKR